MDDVRQYSAENPPPYPVNSVNQKRGDVQLTADDVGADEKGTASSAVYTHDTNGDSHADIREQLANLASGKADKDNIYLNFHADGLLYLFVDGKPVGKGVAIDKQS